MRLIILAPAIAGLGFVLVMFGVYSILCAIGRTPDIKGVDRRRFTEILGPHLVRFMLWLIRPVERAVVAGGVSPNAITLVSLLLCIASGITIANGHLATGAWLYAFGGITDILDGRIARATNRQTKAGALFDSVSDRWGELAVLTGCAWYLHEDAWLFTAMLAIAGSVMVSYTRARGEGLGVNLDGGMMQRAERIIVVSLGALFAGWFQADPADLPYAAPALGAALVLCGAFASATAIGRWIDGYRLLAAREAEAERLKESATSAIKSQVPAG
jgi:CDP-diacylglycerol--glycerol-3-phosphate 3-phosphatidyltransferase